ncbi:MAG: DUF3473 domain-containing protein [bacterium]|nr:DUF3473 domain-containing protein [bacterium]
MSQSPQLPLENTYVNALSIDVEEYFHASNLASVAPPAVWHTLPTRVEKSTYRILELLQENNTRATFFILGYIAQRHKRMISDIAAAGHEIGSHGYGHQLVFEQTPELFFQDINRSRRMLEDMTGTSINGYRAPSFSITNKTPWAYEKLVLAGYSYDSSLYPIMHPRYNNRDKSLTPYRQTTPLGDLQIIPLAVSNLNYLGREIRLPVAGGAYWRLFPPFLIKAGLKHINQYEHRSFVCYFHPWEIDPEQPDFPDLPPVTKFRHKSGSKALLKRISNLLREFKFSTINDVFIKN